MNTHARKRLRGLAVAAFCACATAFAGPTLASDVHSSRHTFGGNPLPISLGPGGRAANGDSGGAAVSGDNRKTRLAAFHSSASNLVRRDSNGRVDVFVWKRPRGRAGLTLGRPS